MIPLWVKVIVALALVAALVTACQHRDKGLIAQGRAEQFAVDQAAADKLKVEARTALEAETARVTEAQYQLYSYTRSLEAKREKTQTVVRTVQRDIPRLQFTTESDRCGRSGDSAAAQASGPAADPTPTVVQLPDPVAADIWEYAGDAESLAVDYAILYEWAHNPKMVCTLQP
jgi:hypothetical protein